MAISKRYLQERSEECYSRGLAVGKQAGIEQAKKDLLLIRQAGIVEITRAVADLAMANAKLTYALSRITDKLL